MDRAWSIEAKGERLKVWPDRLKCPFCAGIMYPHPPTTSGPTDAIGYPGGFQIDLRFKCSRCGYLAVFGVPITAEEYEHFRGKEVETPEAEVAERLQALGYW
jgi:hypothetical protein